MLADAIELIERLDLRLEPGAEHDIAGLEGVEEIDEEARAKVGTAGDAAVAAEGEALLQQGFGTDEYRPVGALFCDREDLFEITRVSASYAPLTRLRPLATPSINVRGLVFRACLR